MGNEETAHEEEILRKFFGAVLDAKVTKSKDRAVASHIAFWNSAATGKQLGGLSEALNAESQNGVKKHAILIDVDIGERKDDNQDVGQAEMVEAPSDGMW